MSSSKEVFRKPSRNVVLSKLFTTVHEFTEIADISEHIEAKNDLIRLYLENVNESEDSRYHSMIYMHQKQVEFLVQIKEVVDLLKTSRVY